jgi:phosphate uptake regulator
MNLPPSLRGVWCHPVTLSEKEAADVLVLIGLRGYLDLILISRCLERVGDHVTNIAEDAV